MAYRVEIGPSALREAEEAYLYLMEEAPTSATEWYNGLVEAVYSLEDLPGRAALAPEGAEVGRPIRQLFYGKRGGVYRILFEITGQNLVRVLHIRHGSRETLTAEELDQA